MPIMLRLVSPMPGAKTATEPCFCEILPTDNLATAIAIAFAVKNTPGLPIPLLTACATKKVPTLLLANMMRSMTVDGFNASLSTIFSHTASFLLLRDGEKEFSASVPDTLPVS